MKNYLRCRFSLCAHERCKLSWQYPHKKLHKFVWFYNLYNFNQDIPERQSNFAYPLYFFLYKPIPKDTSVSLSPIIMYINTYIFIFLTLSNTVFSLPYVLIHLLIYKLTSTDIWMHILLTIYQLSTFSYSDTRNLIVRLWYSLFLVFYPICCSHLSLSTKHEIFLFALSFINLNYLLYSASWGEGRDWIFDHWDSLTLTLREEKQRHQYRTQ